MKKFYSFLVIAAVMASVAIPGSVFALSTASVDVQASTNNNNEQIRAQISALMAQIESLRSQLKENQGQNKPFMVSEAARPVSVSASGSFCYDFNANMSSRGALGKEDITALNTVLAKEGLATLDAQPVFSEQAVKNYQARYADEVLRPVGLSAPTGFVGAATRSKLNRMYGCANKPMVRPIEKPSTVTDKSSVEVVSPNGGESWFKGVKQVVKWQSQNIPSDNQITIALRHYPDGNPNSVNYQDYGIISNVNDGAEEINIDSYPVGVYNLQVKTVIGDYNIINDWSGSFFKIYPAQSGGVYGDVTGDKLVNTNDLLAVINAWGPCKPTTTAGAGCPTDINTDLTTNNADLDIVIKNWTK